MFDVVHHVRILEAHGPLTLANLAAVAVANTPELRGPFGYRLLRSPVAGYPAPHVVIWEEPAEHSRTFPIFHFGAPKGVCTVCAPTRTSAYQVAYLAERSCALSAIFRRDIARLDASLLFDGASVDPHTALEVGAVDSATFTQLPPAQSARIATAPRWRTPYPRHLDLVLPEDVSVAECSHEIVIHSLQAAPFSLWSSPVARPLKVRDAAALALHSSPGACTRLPVLCPVQAGMPLHLGLLLPNDLPHSGFFAIVDVRRLVSPPRPHFCMVRLPGTVDIKWLRGFLRTTFPEAPPCPWAFFDQDAMQCAIRPTARTHVITVLGPPSRRPGEAPFLLPALVDTLELLALRPGWFQASARYPGASALPAYAPRSLPIPGSGDVLRILPDLLDDDVVTLWDCSLEPLQELDCLQEVIVHSLVSSPTRTYISTLWRPDQVEAFLLQLLDVLQASLCWPTWAPCMAGDPLHLALVPLSLGDRFILVDARRVHPALDFGFWLIPAPAQLSRAELMATFLDSRNVAITPAGYRLNGVRMIADFSPPVGISLVTLQACSLGGLQCATYNLAALSRLPGFCAAYAGPLTSTTTTVPRGHLAHGVSTTTTTSGPPPVDRAALLRARPDVRGSFIMSLDGKMIRFHVVGPSGHVEIAATVRDVTVEAVMTQLCVQLLDANELLPGLLFQACDRIVSDTDWGFSVFLCCRPGDHAGLAWIDARPMGLAPFSVALPFVLDERSLQAACGVDIPFDACIAVCGIPWHGTPRALRHCDVVSIRANFHQLFTLPLAALNSRVAGFATMLVQQRGPDHAPTTRCFTVDSICANWQLVHLSSSLALCAEDVYQKCILVAADFPPFPVTIGARVSPVETEVNCWYQTWLKPMFRGQILEEYGTGLW